jgi:hypothetical protein
VPKSQQKTMKPEDLSIILDNSTYPQTLVNVFVSGFIEPLSVFGWFDMLSIIDKHPLVQKLILFTTGYNLSSIDELLELKKIHINFHINQTNTNKLLFLINETQANPNITFRGVGNNECEYSSIKKVLDKKNIKFLFQPIISRAGNLWINQTTTSLQCCKTSNNKCPVVLPNGNTLICSNDFGCTMPIGNLLNQKWNDLDFEIIENLQKTPSNNIPCFRGCHLAVPIVKFL